MTSVTMPRWTLYVIVVSLVATLAFSLGAVYTASGTSHADTYYACLFAGSLTQVNTTAPPANCGRGAQIEWTSFGGTIDASMIAEGSLPGSVIQDGTIDKAKLTEEFQQELKLCGLLPREGVDWSGCDLSGASLTSENLTGANLSGATLTGANLTGATLTGANLTGADLTTANLTTANLSDANLTDANLTGASFFFTVVANVIWSNTTCPNGENSDDHGNTCVGQT